MKPIKSLFGKSLLSALFFFTILTAGASARCPVPETNNSIEFVKADGDTLLFATKLHNLPKSGCTLYIKDADGNTLFAETIKSESHIKLYRINKQNMNGVYFEVKSKKILYKESFTFNIKTQETFIVAKS